MSSFVVDYTFVARSLQGNVAIPLTVALLGSFLQVYFYVNYTKT